MLRSSRTLRYGNPRGLGQRRPGDQDQVEVDLGTGCDSSYFLIDYLVSSSWLLFWHPSWSRLATPSGGVVLLVVAWHRHVCAYLAKTVSSV